MELEPVEKVLLVELVEKKSVALAEPMRLTQVVLEEEVRLVN